MTLFGLTGTADAAGRQPLKSGHVPAALARLAPLGTLPSSRRLHLAIGLPLRNEAELDALLQQLYDPASPNYRRYLTPGEFTARFGPTEQDYQALVGFAVSNALAVTFTHPNRLVLDVAGPVADIEKTFNVTLRVYPHPTEGRTFYAPDAEPSVAYAGPILDISGLDNYSLPHPNCVLRPAGVPANPTPNAGTGPSGSYMGSDFRNAYVPGTALTGAGQSVGLLQFDGFSASDITAYESQAGLPNVPLTVVPVDGGVSTPGSGAVEVSLDIEMVISMAPGVSRIYVYEAPNPSPWVDLLSRMANDNLAKQLSCSWGGGSRNSSAETIFKQMRTQGQSFFNATGDSDAFTTTIPFPSDSTNITQVGGTTLTTGSGAAYSSETVWNWGGGTGSSGGVSTYYGLPSYQQGVSMSANLGSTTKRNVPDVALTGDNVYVYANGSGSFVGGTSCAAPLWAGFTALVNQQAVAAGQSPVGFLNPALYTIGKGANYAYCFHDITTGNNFSSSSPSKFSAVTGYDLCTGWGTPNGTNLINALAGQPLVLPPAITTQPANQTVVVGATAGFSVTASGTAPLTYQWTFAGTKLAGATASTLLLTNVQLAQAGSYAVVVTNTAGSITSAAARLTVLVPPAITTQPANQSAVVGASASFSVAATGTTPLAYQWAFAGTKLAGATASTLLLTNVQLAQAGSYAVVVTNTAGSITSAAARLTVLVPPAITTQPSNQTAVVGANASFNVTATGTAPLVYQWTFAGTKLAGATANTLLLTNVQLVQAGTYAVVVTNAAGSITSAVASLTVLGATVVSNSFTLVTEGCPNGVVDPAETVTVNLGLKNTGTANTANLVATLLPTGGILSPSGPQAYGILVTNGAAVAMPFTFTASGNCGDTNTATLQLQDGTANLGTITFSFRLGQGGVTTVFSESFDGVTAPALPAGWTTAASGVQSAWVTSTSTADTSPSSAFSPDPGNIGVNELDSPAISLPAGPAQLTFRHNYNLESTFDGGVLEISIGGGTWTDILTAGGSFISGPYITALSSSWGNPLGGRSAWTGSSGGFITTTVNLPLAASGQSIQLRWRCGSDNGVTGPGWYVDTVSITGSNSVCCTTSADLAVSLGVSPNLVLAGQSLTYALTVANLGPASASSVTLTDTLPAGVTFISASPGCANLGGQVVALVGSLASGAVTNFTVIVTPGGGGLMTNTLTVVTPTPDPDTANNTATMVTTAYAPPTITAQPGSQAVPPGTNVTFQVAATGNAPLAYQWRFYGTNLPGAVSSALTLTNVQAAQAGTYTVLVTNNYGAVFSSNAVLTVLGPPLILSFSVQSDGAFHLSGAGDAGQNYVLLAAPSLNPPMIWSPIQTNQADGNGLFQFVDPGVANRPQRYYRVAR